VFRNVTHSLGFFAKFIVSCTREKMAEASADQMSSLQAQMQNLQAQLQTRPSYERFVHGRNGAKVVRYGKSSPSARIFRNSRKHRSRRKLDTRESD
jgi:hypothetical protein